MLVDYLVAEHLATDSVSFEVQTLDFKYLTGNGVPPGVSIALYKKNANLTLFHSTVLMIKTKLRCVEVGNIVRSKFNFFSFNLEHSSILIDYTQSVYFSCSFIS